MFKFVVFFVSCFLPQNIHILSLLQKRIFYLPCPKLFIHCTLSCTFTAQCTILTSAPCAVQCTIPASAEYQDELIPVHMHGDYAILAWQVKMIYVLRELKDVVGAELSIVLLFFIIIAGFV